MTNEPDINAKSEQPGAQPAQGATSSESRTAGSSGRPKVFEVLSAFLSRSIPEEARREVYMEVLKRVKDASLAGVVHRGNFLELPMPPRSRSVKQALKPLEEILLKATPDLEEKLNEIANEVAHRQLIRAGGRGLAVADLEELGDSFDFDAMINQARQVNASTARAKETKKAKVSDSTKKKLLSQSKPR